MEKGAELKKLTNLNCSSLNNNLVIVKTEQQIFHQHQRGGPPAPET